MIMMLKKLFYTRLIHETLFLRVKIVEILPAASLLLPSVCMQNERVNFTCACYNFYAWKSWLNYVIIGFCNAWTQKNIFIPDMQLKIMLCASVFHFRCLHRVERVHVDVRSCTSADLIIPRTNGCVTRILSGFMRREAF